MLVADMMTSDGDVKAIGRHGISGRKSSVLARAAFEITTNHLLRAGIIGEEDHLGGVGGRGHAVLEAGPQRGYVAAVAVPGDVLHVADIAEEVVVGAEGQLFDIQAEAGAQQGGEQDRGRGCGHATRISRRRAGYAVASASDGAKVGM